MAYVRIALEAAGERGSIFHSRLEQGGSRRRRNTPDNPELEANRVVRSSHAEAGHSKAATALSTLTKYIPADSIAIYFAGLPLLAHPEDGSFTGKWIISGSVFALSPFFAFVIYRTQRVEAASTRRFFKQLLCAQLALAIWLFAVPETPFATFGFYRPSFSSFALIVGTAVVTGLATLLGVENSKS